MLKLNISHTFLLLFLNVVTFVPGWGQSAEAIKEQVYKAMSANDLSQVTAALEQIKNLPATEETGYRGALLMKKAGLLSQPGEKLNTFKEGKEILEMAIASDSANPELRFLRLMIQENAPKILGYDKNLTEDAEVVEASFGELSPGVKAVISSYSSNSKVLEIKG